METPFDTIVAPITGSESAAVAVVRISGPASWDIAALLFEPWPIPVHPRFALYGHFVTGDDGLALPFEEGASYTGERTVELSVHGSRASVSALIDVCLRAGARSAGPGEFTERAFLHGRMDLTQAEGVRDTVEAATQAQLRQANLLRDGVLRDEVRCIAGELAIVLAAIEASVDFSEEVGDLDRPSAIDRLERARERIGRLLSTADAGRILRRGLRIAIVGPPNAGKSSLLNALLGFDRAIVTEVPGTTRDFVEERADLGGVACVLTDTAGLRDTDDPVERLGVERTRRIVESADRIWYVFDGSEGWTASDESALTSASAATRVLANKSDLGAPRACPEGALPISARTGDGLDRLIEEVAQELKLNSASTVWINDRHAPLLESADNAIEQAAALLAQDLPFDLATTHLQSALHDLGRITGETATEDLLERIFRDFCVGK